MPLSVLQLDIPFVVAFLQILYIFFIPHVRIHNMLLVLVLFLRYISIRTPMEISLYMNV